MRDLLQSVIDGLNELRTQVSLNEGRPSADMISAKLMLFESMLVDYRQSLAVPTQPPEAPPAVPQPVYEPDTTVVDETPIAAADADAAFDHAPDADAR